MSSLPGPPPLPRASAAPAAVALAPLTTVENAAALLARALRPLAQDNPTFDAQSHSTLLSLGAVGAVGDLRLGALAAPEDPFVQSGRPLNERPGFCDRAAAIAAALEGPRTAPAHCAFAAPAGLGLLPNVSASASATAYAEAEGHADAGAEAGAAAVVPRQDPRVLDTLFATRALAAPLGFPLAVASDTKGASMMPNIAIS